MELNLKFLILLYVYFKQQIDFEKKTHALGEKDYDTAINQKRTDIYGLDQKLKTLQREKDNLNRDADDRVKLRLKKDALESRGQKLKEMHVPFPFFHTLLFSLLCSCL
jgi:hypothetical protein